MPSLHNIFVAVHLLLLVLFCIATTLLLVVTVVNRMRVRRVLQTWRNAPLRGLPLWPTLFMVIAGLLFVYAAVTNHAVHSLIVGSYLTGGLAWWLASYLASAVIVTEFGLVQHVNCQGQAIAWGQVVDYFAQTERNGERYVFFYLDAWGNRQRLEVEVPRQAHFEFAHTVTTKLDARFNYATQQAYGKAVED